MTRRRRLGQNRCVFSARQNCPRDRSRWRRLSGRLFHSSIVLRFMDSQSEFALYPKASEHHPTSAWVVLRVDMGCAWVDRSSQGKNRTSPSLSSPLPPLHSLPSPPLLFLSSYPLPSLRIQLEGLRERCNLVHYNNNFNYSRSCSYRYSLALSTT